MVSLTQWTWIWVNYEEQWRTGKPGMQESMGSQWNLNPPWVEATYSSCPLNQTLLTPMMPYMASPVWWGLTPTAHRMRSRWGRLLLCTDLKELSLKTMSRRSYSPGWATPHLHWLKLSSSLSLSFLICKVGIRQHSPYCSINTSDYDETAGSKLPHSPSLSYRISLVFLLPAMPRSTKGACWLLSVLI